MTLDKAISLKPGIHDVVPSDWYHADPAGKPSLSSSIARLLVSKSPAHARAAHPVLNPDFVREESDKFDIGTAAHRLFLEGEDAIEVCDYANWRTNAAKEQADAARKDGRIPLLVDQADRVRAMVAAAREQLDAHSAQPPLFADGKPEQTLVWEDDHGVVCRARLDWLRDDYTAISDFKTTSASAAPGAWIKTAYGMGADIQVAWYCRGVERLTGIKPLFRFAVIETYPPYALSVVDLAPAALALARDKAQIAIDIWARCLEADDWPSYTTRVASLEPPTWAEYEWLDRQEAVA